jgi:transcriptional regulator with XRE-family HTH domain
MAALRKPRPRQKIADRLRRLRLASGITQDEAAGKLNITRSQWCMIESGQRSIPAERIVDFAELVNAPVTELLGLKEAA